MTALAYAQLTRDDPNPLKRWVQRRRLADALRLLPSDRRARVVDYGGGDGEFAAQLAEQTGGEVICFEPEAGLRAEAMGRASARMRVTAAASELPSGWAQALFCLEVFEHLPDAQAAEALEQIQRVLEPGGLLVVGLPVEIGPPALVKGLFRWTRRPNAADARWPEILAALIRRPKRERPLASLGGSLPYHPSHLGFDHRRVETLLASRMRVEARRGSPFGVGGGLINSELYILARRAA